MQHISIGIDCDLDGAFVAINEERIVSRMIMPTIWKATAKKKRYRQFDRKAIRKWLLDHPVKLATEGHDVVMGMEWSHPIRHDERVMLPATINKRAKEFLADLSKARGIAKEARGQYMVQVLTEKLKSFQGMCLEGREGTMSAFNHGVHIGIVWSAMAWAVVHAYEVYGARIGLAKDKNGNEEGIVYQDQWHRIASGFPGDEPKARAENCAVARFPGYDFTKSKRAQKLHQGSCDASVIALWLWEQTWPGVERGLERIETQQEWF